MDTIDIITDGACSGNPGRGGWAAIVVVAGHTHEYSGSALDTTNNRMELTAAIEGLRHAPDTGQITMVCDSQYVINGITKWVHTWQRNEWQTRDKQPVENRDLWEQLVAVTSSRVRWQHVKGHSGHALNERANTLAQHHAGSTARQQRSTSAPTSAPTPHATAFPCYVSYVNNTVMQHATWAACQQAVHGVSHAKFKKVASPAELEQQLRKWGVST
ncbi:MAG: ribonuclease [Chloroflexota bacterium]|jgi:ribonuclease HI